MGKPIQVGVIGSGNVTYNYIRLMQRMNLPRRRLEIAITCDVREERRQYVLENYAIDIFTTDEDEVINNPDIDLILVLTSMPEHGRLAKKALLAGKHLQVEKPMAMTLAEGAELVEIAKTSPGYLICAPHVVLSPTYQAMWRHVHDGDLGRIYSARGFYGWAGPWWGPWFYQPGGGSMFDLGVYNVTTLTGLLGPVKRVMAMSGIAIPDSIGGLLGESVRNAAPTLHLYSGGSA